MSEKGVKVTTMAKGYDHEIVGALVTHPKAVPWKIEIKCTVKPFAIRLSTGCYFNTTLLMWALYKLPNTNSKVVSFSSAIVSQFCVRPCNSLRWT
jgi:hypothetical protein